MSPYVEDLDLPDPAKADQIQLPESAHAWTVIQAVCEEKAGAFLTPVARESLRKWFLREANLSMLTHLFWWFCADIFKKGEPKAERLKSLMYEKFSSEYVILNIPYQTTERPTDIYMRLYNTALGEAVIKVFCNCLHKSAHKFDGAFQKRIINQILEWTTGLLPYGAENDKNYRFVVVKGPEPKAEGSAGAGGATGAPGRRMSDIPTPSAHPGGAGPRVRFTEDTPGGESPQKSDTFALTQVGLTQAAQPDHRTQDGRLGIRKTKSAKEYKPWSVGGERKELFDLYTTSPFMQDILANNSLSPARLPALKVSRTVAPEGRDDLDEDSYARFAKKVTTSNRARGEYNMYKEHLNREIQFNREEIKGDISQLEAYRQMVSSGKNARQFSNWLSGWSDAKETEKENKNDGKEKDKDGKIDVEKSRRLRAAAVMHKRVGGGAIKRVRGSDARDKMARAAARSARMIGAGSTSPAKSLSRSRR